MVAALPISTPLFVAILVLGVPVVFVGFWVGICVLLGLVGGWSRLAGRYRCAADEPADAASGQTAMLGLVSYRSVLSVGVADDGLDLRVMALFRPGHPPLRIPWSAITVEAAGWSLLMFGQVTTLRLGEGGPRLRLRSDLWARIVARRGSPGGA